MGVVPEVVEDLIRYRGTAILLGAVDSGKFTLAKHLIDDFKPDAMLFMGFLNPAKNISIQGLFHGKTHLI